MKQLYHYGLTIVVVGVLSVAAAFTTTCAADAATAGHTTPPQGKVMRGTFTQRKYLAELKQPLVSSGRYVVAAQRGLIWQIEKPIQAQLVISRKHLVRRSDGHEITRINANQQPALQIVAAVLLAVFQTDTDQLRQYFKVQKRQGANNQWVMTLHPKSATVAQFADHIRVRGKTHIEHIELYQPSGDHTVIDLHPATDGPNTLSAAEQAEFAH